MRDSETCVLVAGVGGGTPGRELIKAFKIAKHKYKIVVTDMYKDSVGLFETPHKYVIPPASSSDYIDSLLKICKKEGVQVLTTGSAAELEKVAKNVKIFEEQGIKLLMNPYNVIERCMNKYTLMNFLTSKGIQCPKYFLYQQDSDITNIESYPVVIKPTIGSGSRNVFVAQDKDEALFFSNYLIKYGFEPLIQEYIGNHEEEYTVGVVYADSGRLSNSIAMRRTLSHGFSTGQTVDDIKSGKRYIISSYISEGFFDEFTEVRKISEKISHVLEAHGPINVQCRKTDVGILPFEVNPRFSATIGARSLVGFNEPDIFCRYLLFDEISHDVNYKHGYVIRDLHEKYLSAQDVNDITQL